MTIASNQQTGYFKLATFCNISQCWKDGKKMFKTNDDAIKAAVKKGRYRVSFVSINGRQDLEPFER